MSGFYYYYNVPSEDVFFGVFGVAYMAIMLFAMGLGLLQYILGAIGQMKMAQKCGIDKPWLAFIPVANAYNLGLIAEKYDDGKPTSKKYSKILLGLNIATVVGSIVFSVVSMVLTVMIVAAEELSSGGETAAAAGAGFVLLFVFIMMAYLTLAIVTSVFTYIALYRVFRIFAPDNAVLFLVLSIFVSIAYPIIMLVLSSKEPVSLRRDYYYAPYNDGYNGN